MKNKVYYKWWMYPFAMPIAISCLIAIFVIGALAIAIGIMLVILSPFLPRSIKESIKLKKNKKCKKK
jgi:hypothetical protein